MRLATKLLTVVAVLVVGTVVAYYPVVVASGVEGFSPLSTDFPLLRAVTTAMAMLVGIVGNAVWTAAGKVPEGQPAAFSSVAQDALRSSGFIKAAVVSPLVFIAVYALIRNEPDPVVAHLLAFQNGFFWESVMER